MNFKNTLAAVIFVLILAACASEPIDPLDPTISEKNNLRPQCPIGYEPVYSTEIIIKKDDDEKKSGRTKQTFKCEPIK